MVKKRKNNGRNKKGEQAPALPCFPYRSPTDRHTRRPRPRQAHPVLQLLAMHPQGQGHQAVHHPQHGRVCGDPYVHSTSRSTTRGPPRSRARTIGRGLDLANTLSLQVISRTLRCSPSTRFPRCTSSCSTASLALSTARLSGTFVHMAGTTASAFSATRAAEMNLGRTSAKSYPTPPTENMSR